MPSIEKLIFVYNADAKPLAGFFESAHKILKPETYPCHLCNITHGIFGEKLQWKKFRKRAEIPLSFLHKNEFLKQYRSKWLPNYTFPIILAKVDNRLETFMLASEVESFQTLEEFISGVEKKIRLFEVNT